MPVPRSRILVVLGTRPEAIKLAPVIAGLRATGDVDVHVCASGQHLDLLTPVLRDLGLVPDSTLPPLAASAAADASDADLAEQLAALLTALAARLRAWQPTRVLVQGDTSTALAAGLAAFFARIPLAHVEAGLRSGRLDAPWPEEFNRRVVTLAADLHFAPTERAVRRLRAEGVAPARIHLTGNTVVDALHQACARLDGDPRLTAAVAATLPPPVPRLVVATLHRRESIARDLAAQCAALRTLTAQGAVQVAIPVHANPRVRTTIERELGGVAGIHLLPPLGHLAFIALLRRAWLVVTDSGGIQEEAAALGVPVLIVRAVTERHELVAAGGGLLIGADGQALVGAVESLLVDTARYDAMRAAPNPFGDGQAARRIVAVLTRRLDVSG